MKNFTKKLIGTIIIGAITIASFTSAFAETNVTRDPYIIANPIEKTVIKSDKKIQPCNCCCHCCRGVIGTGVFTGNITDITNKTIRNSIANIEVFENSSTINTAGRNVEITSADTFTIDGSATDTIINDVKSRIRTISR